MLRVGVIGFIYVMLLLTYMFRVGVIWFLYVMLLLTYMFRVEGYRVYICNVTVDIYV